MAIPGVGGLLGCYFVPKELGDFLSQAVEVELEDDAQPSSAALIIDNLYDDVTAAEGDCDVTID